MSNDTHEENNAVLWARDVADVGVEGAKTRWQTKWASRKHWAGPLVSVPFWDSVAEYRRDPCAPPLPGDEPDSCKNPNCPGQTVDEFGVRPCRCEKPDSEGWFSWHGNESGKCPLPLGCQFQVKWRKERSPDIYIYTAPDLYWKHQGNAGDIIAYRVIEPASEPADDGVLSKASSDVLAERERQKSIEGWTPEHDDTHDGEELARAALSYAMPWSLRGITGMPDEWPWDREWWKPDHFDRRRELVKAGALILAEIERLDRKPTTRHLIDADGKRWEWPAPMSEAPADGDHYWLPSINTGNAYCIQKVWSSLDHTCLQQLEAGICHASPRNAVAQAKRLIAASKGGQS